MKKHILSIAFAVTTLIGGATVITVDNNGNAPSGVEASLTVAVTNATVGDTLLIIPSSTSYGNVILNKQLTVIGVGFNPDMEIPFTSKVGNVTVQPAASGSKVIGLEITGQFIFGGTAGSLSDVVLENCRINYINSTSISSLTNILIRQNIIQNQVNVPAITFSVANQANIMITNNIFSSISTPFNYYGPSVTTGGAVFDHNLFLGSSSQSAFFSLNNCLVKNNIFLGRYPGAHSNSAINVVYQNNISTDYAFSAIAGSNISIDGNIDSTNPIFENLTIGTITYDYTMDPNMSVSSPGENAGTDGTSLGVSGGTSPFKLSGSVLPVVRRFIVPSNITQGQNADATIEVTGN
ncbi:MAG: hypothetical protein AB8B73_14480 [Ekhidna sp.]